MNISDFYRAVGPVSLPETRPTTGVPSKPSQGPSEFGDLLARESATQVAPPAKTELNFSQHAETRIRSRAIDWNPALESRIRGGLDAAESKGSRETLILAGDVAVIANVKSRTIITAMDRAQLKERIFTNIDSAVLV